MKYRTDKQPRKARLVHTRARWPKIFFSVFLLIFFWGCVEETTTKHVTPKATHTLESKRTIKIPKYTKPAVKPPSETGEQICLSMRVLAHKAENALTLSYPMPKKVSNLAGIGWLEGFVVDKENNDLILIGRRHQNRPSLHLDDLVASIRNIWQGNTPPYCSLDPRQEDIIKVNHIFLGAGNVTNVAQMHLLFSQLQNVWGPQTVVTGGVPTNSRHAHVMIDADYHMKKVSQGLVKVPGITSYLDRALDKAKNSVRTSMTAPTSQMSMARFWFHIGKESPTFTEGDRIVWLDKCSIVLLTEKQMATADGKLYDSGGDDPHARAFAEEFSKCFVQAAIEVPVYAYLENFFRLQALVRAMHFQNATKKAALDLRFYLRRYKYQMDTPMPGTMPGLVNYREARETLTSGLYIYEFVLFPMVCGGVSMEIDVDTGQFAKKDIARLDQLRSAVIKARPSIDTLYWPLKPNLEVSTEPISLEQ